MHLASTHQVPGGMLGTVYSQPCLNPSEGPLSPARNSMESTFQKNLWEGTTAQGKGDLVRDSRCPATVPEPMHCRERRWRTLEVPDTVGQEEATGFMGSSSQSSLASQLPPKMMTKLRSEKNPLPATKSGMWRWGPRKKELVEKQIRKGGKLMAPLWS